MKIIICFSPKNTCCYLQQLSKNVRINNKSIIYIIQKQQGNILLTTSEIKKCVYYFAKQNLRICLTIFRFLLKKLIYIVLFVYF